MVDNLHLSALRTQSLPFRIQEFVDSSVLEIANKTLVRAIREEALLKKMPKRYVNGIKSDFDGKELWIWVEFKGKKGEPLDLFFEEGTVDHPILPVKKKALSWLMPGAIGIVTAIRLFSKGHWISGIEARHIFRDGAKKGYPEFKRLLQKEIEDYLKETSLFS